MIGFFVFDDVPSVDSPLVLAHSALNDGIQGLFYVRASDCKDISTVSEGSEFFGVLDDSSGFGACLFIKNLDGESDAMLLQKNLHVKGNTTIDGNQKTTGNSSVKGKLDVTGNIKTSAMITGSSPNTTINLTAAHACLILSAGLSGSAATLSNVPVIMSNE